MHASAIYYLKANVFLTVNNTSEIYPVYGDLKKGRVGRNGGSINNGQELRILINSLLLQLLFSFVLIVNVY